MKTALTFLLQIVKWIIIIGILLFSLATFIGKAYGQTLVFVLIALSLAYWPTTIRKKRNNKVFYISRIVFILLLIAVIILFFPPEPKTSIYFTPCYKEKLLSVYDKKLDDWPDNSESIYIQTKYGYVHVLACGLKENPPLMMIHAASMGAHSWAENLDPLLEHYRIYSFDNIGEGNRSELDDVNFYPTNGKEIADLYASLADSLGIRKSPVFGASNGGFITMNYAYYYPEKVEAIVLIGPMGLTRLTAKSLMMLSLASLYPFDFIRNYVLNWALGDDDYVVKKYGDWFNCILEGTMPSFAKPVPMTTEQKNQMKLPVLLFLGTKDPIVGDAETAEQKAKDFPNIHIEILESGHLIAVEYADYVNHEIRNFFDLKESDITK